MIKKDTFFGRHFQMLGYENHFLSFFITGTPPIKIWFYIAMAQSYQNNNTIGNNQL